MLSAKLKEAAGNSADATLYVDDVFSTWLYTGNGSTQTITNGIDLAGKGGLVWNQSRSNTYGGYIYDTARGTNRRIHPFAPNGQTTTTQDVTAFNSNGFTMGSEIGINGGSGQTYVSWTFRKAAKFFDVVTYTGNGVNGRVITHNLGCEAGMVIIKKTSASSSIGWAVGHRSSANLCLNSTGAAGTDFLGDVTNLTSASFTVSSYTDVNQNGATFVAYIYAHDTAADGIIQCGSFTTDGSGNATVNLGWEPQYVLRKRNDSTGNWFIEDVMRGDSQTGVKHLFANATDAESDGGGWCKPTATGFQAFSLGTAVPFIYMAIRRPNKPPTTGTQVYIPLTANNAQGTQNTTSFTVDMQLAKYRLGAIGTYDADRLRGVSTTSTTGGQHLTTSSTDAETSSNATQFWNNTGFQTSSGWASTSMVYWNFQRAHGFFDVVAYRGSPATPPVTHNLGVVPELIIQKNRDGGAFGNWFAFNATQYLVLNLNNAATAWSSSITSTTFQPVSQSGGTNYVAYLFATLAEISKVGSYTGNGTGQAIACGFTGGARFVLIKRTDSTGDWYTYDSARGLTSGSSPYLLLNSIAVEVTGNNGVYASTGGFTLGATAITTTNIATATYIFLAIA
jgi:hypothetical protein